MWISLCCLLPATGGGGQTPIADMRVVTAAIHPQVLDRFARHGVKYTRHYHPRVDLPWENVFQTNDREEVARICREHDIHHEWLDSKTLRTEQVCQGVADHPVTGETVFFNQAHLFHVSSVGPKAAEDMIDIFGRDRLPRHAKFGNGAEIEVEDLRAVRAAFDSAAIDIHWQRGDVIIIDNMRFAHGRRTFRGTRRVLAALLNPYRPS